MNNLMAVGRWRHIQTVYETGERRNPDTFVRNFLPWLERWRCAWLGQEQLGKLRAEPFYYYLVARTKYYDEVFTDAIRSDVHYIANIGCGSDTRAYRFGDLLKQKGITVLEGDQPEAISARRHVAKGRKSSGRIEYLSIDINDEVYPDLEHWLDEHKTAKALVLMEGVSPYVNDSAFSRFLELLATQLPTGSRVAYDFKFRGYDDHLGRVGRTQTPFRLPNSREEILAYHKNLGYSLEHMEPSCELEARLLPDLASSGVPLYMQDGLVRIEVR